MTRRELLQSAALLGLAGPLVSAVEPFLPAADGGKKPVLRIGHLTDVHMFNEKNAAKGLEKCLHHVQDRRQRPDILFNTGDSIMDALGASKADARAQWDLWHRVWRSENALPVVHCIGNHDVWGLREAQSDPLYGKKWATDEFGIPNRYYSFDRAGWHFIVLDSTHPKPDGGWYTAKLDEEQFIWLEQELEKTPAATPVMVLSHIPILSASVFFDGDNAKTGNWVIPGSWMHIDSARIVGLFYRHPNVKVCLSGHIHLVDRTTYNGVTYLCNGAVSGAWWDGRYHETEEGYAVVNLFADGTFACEYVDYGWAV